MDVGGAFVFYRTQLPVHLLRMLGRGVATLLNAILFR